MPSRPPKNCTHTGCPLLAHDGPRCDVHGRAYLAELSSLRPSAAARGYGRVWRLNRLDFLRRNPLCVACLREGRNVPATEADHVVPKARHGTDDWSNLQALCKRCHSAKTAREDGRWGRKAVAR